MIERVSIHDKGDALVLIAKPNAYETMFFLIVGTLLFKLLEFTPIKSATAFAIILILYFIFFMKFYYRIKFYEKDFLYIQKGFKTSVLSKFDIQNVEAGFSQSGKLFNLHLTLFFKDGNKEAFFFDNAGKNTPHIALKLNELLAKYRFKPRVKEIENIEQKLFINSDFESLPELLKEQIVTHLCEGEVLFFDGEWFIYYVELGESFIAHREVIAKMLLLEKNHLQIDYINPYFSKSHYYIALKDAQIDKVLNYISLK